MYIFFGEMIFNSCFSRNSFFCATNIRSSPIFFFPQLCFISQKISIWVAKWPYILQLHTHTYTNGQKIGPKCICPFLPRPLQTKPQQIGDLGVHVQASRLHSLRSRSDVDLEAVAAREWANLAYRIEPRWMRRLM